MSNYPPGAEHDPYAPYNYVECPDCEEQMPAPMMADHVCREEEDEDEGE